MHKLGKNKSLFFNISVSLEEFYQHVVLAYAENFFIASSYL